MNTSPIQHLIALGKECVGIWSDADNLRAGKGNDLPNWPEWCWLPMAGAAALAGKYFTPEAPEFAGQFARIAALVTWRLTQGIYVFDKTLFDSLVQTPLTGKLPTEVFYRLPEWCIYIDTQGTQLFDGELNGFWVHLEFDIKKLHNELRILLDTEKGLFSRILHLEKETVYDAMQDAFDEGEHYAEEKGLSTDGLIPTPEQVKKASQALHPLLSLVIYLCSTGADLGNVRPSRPQAVKTKKGLRYFPPNRPRQWDVGFRIGAVIRAYEDREKVDSQGGTHASPRAHIRRAHWHSYWTRVKRGILKVYWLPPIPVGVKGIEDLIPTIHPVKGESTQDKPKQF